MAGFLKREKYHEIPGILKSDNPKESTYNVDNRGFL
jgi:hypothetical protein